jgi:molybdenum-dependent DNA-binding transcriptional regulator ModE
MPQPIVPIHQWEQVRDTAVACGSIKRAAEQHGVSYVAARQRARREQWPVARRLSKAIEVAKGAARKSIEAQQGHVTSVTSAADALVDILAEDERETRLSLSRSARQLAAQGETASLDEAHRVHDVAKTAALVHRWDRQQHPNILNVAVLANQIEVRRVEDE